VNFTPPPFEKIRYLLDDPGKGKFFKAVGFAIQDWSTFATAILNMAVQNQHALVFRRTTIHGREYDITGDLKTPIGRNVSVKSGWWMDPGQTDTLRFVTAYPNDQPQAKGVN